VVNYAPAPPLKLIWMYKEEFKQGWKGYEKLLLRKEFCIYLSSVYYLSSIISHLLSIYLFIYLLKLFKWIWFGSGTGNTPQSVDQRWKPRKTMITLIKWVPVDTATVKPNYLFKLLFFLHYWHWHQLLP